MWPIIFLRAVFAYTLIHLTFPAPYETGRYHNLHVKESKFGYLSDTKDGGRVSERQAWQDTGREGRLFAVSLVHLDHRTASSIISKE